MYSNHKCKKCDSAFAIEIKIKTDNKQVRFCPHCSSDSIEEISREGYIVGQMDYEPKCKHGYIDCIGDPAYQKHYYNRDCGEDYCDDCEHGEWYDDEDK